MTTTPTTTPAAMPATLVLLDFLLTGVAVADDVESGPAEAERVTTTVSPGATLVTTDGAAVVLDAALVAAEEAAVDDAADEAAEVELFDEEAADDAADPPTAWTLVWLPVVYIDQ